MFTRPLMVLALTSLLILSDFQPLVAQPDAGTELLNFVRDAHRASRDSIRTCSCRVEFNGTLVRPGSGATSNEHCAGQFWYSADAARGKVSEHGKEVDYVLKNSIRSAVTRVKEEGGTTVSAVREVVPRRYLGRCDAFSKAFLVLNLPNTTESIPFEDLVDSASRFKSAKWEVNDGQRCAVIHLIFEPGNDRQKKWDVKIYFDPSVNYLVRRASYISSANYHRDDQVTKFEECSPGIFFPVALAGRSGLDGKPNFTHRTQITEIKVNQPLPKDIFTFRWPNGVYLFDKVRGSSYRVNADGVAVSSEIPIEKIPVIPPPAAGEELQQETTEEPRRAGWWILPVSGALVGVAVVVAFLRRFKRGDQAR
jgi:hypothetical protein